MSSSISSEEIYCKISNKYKCHKGYYYNTGLNVLDKPFEPKGSCVPGGLYFTNLKNIDSFYSYGDRILIVNIPTDAQVVKDPDETYGEKWRADKIIVCDEYPLYDIETIKKFNLKINKPYLEWAVSGGHVDVLEFCKNTLSSDALSSLPSRELHFYVHIASKYGHINVLEWFRNNYAYQFKTVNVNHGMEFASYGGHVNVLEWLKTKSGCCLEKVDSYNGVHYASADNNVKVLDWWKNSGFSMKNTQYSFLIAVAYGSNEAIEWWKNSGLLSLE
jgi:hypothetical protein